MLHKLKKFNKKIPFLIGLMSISFLAAQPAEAKIIFKNEFLIEDNGSNAFILDARDNVTGDLSLQFGNTLAESITFDTGNDWFEFSNDVSLNDNRLISAEIENVSALPGGGVGLGAGGTGRFVFLTTLDSPHQDVLRVPIVRRAVICGMEPYGKRRAIQDLVVVFSKPLRWLKAGGNIHR